MDKILLLFIFLAGLIAGIAIPPLFHSPTPGKTIIVDTVYVPETLVDTVVRARYHYIVDTVRPEVDVDSIWASAKEYWREKENGKPGLYAATYDSTGADSAFSLQVEYVQRIPLDPMGRFHVNLDVRRREITHVIERQPTFWDRFGVGIVAGAGFDPLASRPTTFVGVAGYFEILGN